MLSFIKSLAALAILYAASLWEPIEDWARQWQRQVRLVEARARFRLGVRVRVTCTGCNFVDPGDGVDAHETIWTVDGYAFGVTDEVHVVVVRPWAGTSGLNRPYKVACWIKTEDLVLVPDDAPLH